MLDDLRAAGRNDAPLGADDDVDAGQPCPKRCSGGADKHQQDEGALWRQAGYEMLALVLQPLETGAHHREVTRTREAFELLLPSRTETSILSAGSFISISRLRTAMAR